MSDSEEEAVRIEFNYTPFDEVLEFIKYHLDDCLVFNEDRHKKKVEYFEEFMECLETSMNATYLPEHTGLVVEQIDDGMNNAIGVAISIAKYTQRGVHQHNDICALCLEDEAKEPVYCLQCLKIVSCKNCMIEMVKNTRHFIKCLRCQRKSLVSFPFFYSANLSKTKE